MISIAFCFPGVPKLCAERLPQFKPNYVLSDFKDVFVLPWHKFGTNSAAYCDSDIWRMLL